MPTMLPDNAFERRAIRLVILILSSYGPFCLAYAIWVLAAKFWHPLSFGRDNYLNNTTLWILWAPEAVWYLWFQVMAMYLQREAVHPPRRTKEEREALFTKVRGEIYDPERFLQGWFRGSPVEDIGRDSLHEFVEWAFWDRRTGSPRDEGDEEEIEEYVQRIEKMIGKTFPPGKGRAKSLRLTLDPIEVESRSILWYALIMLADTLAIVLLMAHGLHYHRKSLAHLGLVFPPRPAALLTRDVSVAKDYSYFLRKHTSKTRLPIVHLHGIGIGLLSHVEFLNELHHTLNDGAPEDDQVGILAIECIQISSRLTTSIPRRVESLAQITEIIDTHFGTGRFVLVSHSYGSVLSAHILNDPHLSPRLSGSLFVDPVSILLHMPDVAYNFTIRPPVKAAEYELNYFASRDPQIAHTLGRHFFWSENVLWRDRIDYLINTHKMRFTASLASEDLIVNTNAVRAYLTERDLPDPILVEDVNGQKEMHLQTHTDNSNEKARKWSGNGLEILWWSGYNHANVFDQKRDRAKLIDVLVEYVRGK